MSLSLCIERLQPAHDRSAFSCGAPALDRYLAQQAGQDLRRRMSNCFVAIDSGTGIIAGFYTFAASGISLDELPEETARRLPYYPMVPAALIGRLAVDLSYAGQGVGSILVRDALLRAARSEPCVFALLVDAKDERASGFYRRLGFESLRSKPLSLFLPVG